MSDDVPVPCAADGFGMPRPAIDDEERDRVDPDLPHVIDAHVHLFPDRVFEAIWRWFDRYGWPIRYKLHAHAIVQFMLARGVGKIVALHYAHKPGIARALNDFMAEIVRDQPRVRGVATVFPGEPDSVAILRDAFAGGLQGLKLHCHVQGVAPDDPALNDVYALCESLDQPLVIHAGREPKSPAYPVDVYSICRVDRLEAVLRSFPKLRVCVPHLGADEFAGYADLLRRYDNLWLDTTMVLGDYFAMENPRWLLDVRPERVLYGTDFPNIPYAWDRELVRIKKLGLSDARLDLLLHGAATDLYRL